MLALLVGPYACVRAAGRRGSRISRSAAGRSGLALMFVFTAVGHFVQPAEMAQMLPAAVPWRVEIIYASGVLELALAAALLVPAVSTAASWAAIAFLTLVL